MQGRSKIDKVLIWEYSHIESDLGYFDRLYRISDILELHQIKLEYGQYEPGYFSLISDMNQSLLFIDALIYYSPLFKGVHHICRELNMYILLTEDQYRFSNTSMINGVRFIYSEDSLRQILNRYI